MTSDPGAGHLTLLQRLDLALASRIAQHPDAIDLGRPEDWRHGSSTANAQLDSRWVGRILALRGFEIDPREIAHALHENRELSARSSQEARLIRGLDSVLRTVRDHAAAGRLPDGWFAVELFRQLTAEIPRFRGNALRRDMPWDGHVSVRYPDSNAVPGLLEGFCAQQSYGESGTWFESAHPVRQAVRVLWRFARIAPFPDFNTVMGFVLMDAYLLAKGYPMVAPSAEDRPLLNQILAGPPPRRVVQFESRLLSLVTA
jgi:hypothetical protein